MEQQNDITTETYRLSVRELLTALGIDTTDISGIRLEPWDYTGGSATRMDLKVTRLDGLDARTAAK